MSRTPRAPSVEMMEIQLGYIMARQQESNNVLALQMDKIRTMIQREMERIHRKRGVALTSAAVDQIFSICEFLKVSDHVKYAAAEIYDRFMILYNEDLTIQLSKLEDKSVIKETERRIRSQTLLRIASCVQLASKAYGDETHLPLLSTQIVEMLEQHKQTFALKAVNASELRVTKLLNFDIQCVTTLDAIELILIQLELDIPMYRKIYEFCIFFLDHIYHEHSTVYNCLYNLAISKNARLDRNKFKKIEYNKLVEASGIVGCCIYLINPSEYKVYVHAISRLTQVDENTFTDLAAVLIKCGIET